MRPRPAPAPERPHVLVVDDEPGLRAMLADALAGEGYRVTVRGDAAAALATLAADPAELLLTDLKMPGTTGIELVGLARARCPSIGCVLLTGHATTDTAIQALREGVDDMLTKPVGLEDLRRVLARVLARTRLLGGEREAAARARREADGHRDRSRAAEAALASAQEEARASRADLERRVRDLELVHELTRVLALEDDLDRVLATTAQLLAVRFAARVVRVEIAIAGQVHLAEHVAPAATLGARAALAGDLAARTRRRGGVVSTPVLDGGEPLETLAVPVDLVEGPVGLVALVRPLPARPDPGDHQLLGHVPRALSIGIEAERQRQAARAAGLQVALGLLETLEGRGALPRGHGERVARLARRLATSMGLSSRFARVVETAARLHDVGEAALPDGVLQRPGPLTEAEREILRGTPATGARILAPFGEAALYVRHHRERPDGSGYPDRLRGDDIPMGAGIVAVAEAYDAMTHHRPWRASRSRREALEEIHRGRGRQFLAAPADALAALPPEGA